MLTAERLRELLHYDPETGVFTRRIARRGYRAGTIAGCLKNDGYVLIRVDGVLYRAHRLAWLYMYGRWPSDQIDHRFNARNDNRLSKLREATDYQNKQNVHAPRTDNKCGLRGVYQRKNGKWLAQIQHQKQYRYLGLFDTPEEARSAYLTAKSNLHPFGEVGT